MLKKPLTENIIKILEKNNYVTSEYYGCFDIAAKKELFLLLKLLQNVDSFSCEQAKNLKIISRNLNAHPLLIGIQTRTEKLKRGIVYERFELATISPETLEDLIRYEIFPNIYRDRGGLYVEIDQELLRETRSKRGLTQRELAQAVGINKKVIYEHEKKQLKMLLSIAERLENILNKKIIKEIDLFKKTSIEHGKPSDKLENIVGKDLKKLGFEIDFVKQAPFDVFAREKVLLISDVEENKRKMFKRAIDLRRFIDVAKRPAVLITEKTKEEDLQGIPIVKRKELEEFESGKDLIRIAKKGK